MESMYELIPPVVVGGTTITKMIVAKYSNGRPAVELYSIISPEDGGDGTAVEPWCTLSVNLPDQFPGSGNFFAKSYDYTRDTFEAMLNAGYIDVTDEPPGIAGMHGECPSCRLTDKATANEIPETA